MNLLKNRYVFGGLLALTLADVMNLLYCIWQDRDLINNSTRPWMTFYASQIYGGNESVLHMVLFIGLFPVAISWLLIYQNNSKLNNFVLSRSDRKHYLTKVSKRLFVLAAGYRLFLLLLEILVVGLYYHQLNLGAKFTANSVSFRLFSTNAGMQWVAYGILSMIGWGVWVQFIYSVCLFVKKTVLTIPTALLLGFGCSTIGIIMASIKIPVFDQFFYGTFLANIQAPGMLFFNGVNGPALVYAVTSIVFYMLIQQLITQLYINQVEQGKLD